MFFSAEMATHTHHHTLTSQFSTLLHLSTVLQQHTHPTARVLGLVHPRVGIWETKKITSSQRLNLKHPGEYRYWGFHGVLGILCFWDQVIPLTQFRWFSLDVFRVASWPCRDPPLDSRECSKNQSQDWTRFARVKKANFQFDRFGFFSGTSQWVGEEHLP